MSESKKPDLSCLSEESTGMRLAQVFDCEALERTVVMRHRPARLFGGENRSD